MKACYRPVNWHADSAHPVMERVHLDRLYLLLYTLTNIPKTFATPESSGRE
jgi:hypothetical protein